MRAQTVVRLLFVIRVCLWLIALSSTLYWMHLSNDLYRRGIFDPLEFANYFRPVFYPCVITAFVAIGISFALYAVSKHLKKKTEDAKKTAYMMRMTPGNVDLNDLG